MRVHFYRKVINHIKDTIEIDEYFTTIAKI